MKINEENGRFTGPSEVCIVRLLPGPIERVWEYLTDPGKRARWFAGGPMEQRKGGKLTLKFLHKNIAPDEVPPADYAEVHNKGMEMEGVVTRCEPPRVLAYTFGSDSEVTFELSEQGRNVQLVLTHRSKGEDLPELANYGSGWHTHIALLLAILEGTKAPPFWATHARLLGEYEKLRAKAQKA